MSLTDVKIRNTKAKHKANQANRLAVDYTLKSGQQALSCGATGTV
ncbi:MAG: hypothetical protein ACREV3_02980 [Gammaproteobacteria bacterium]